MGVRSLDGSQVLKFRSERWPLQFHREEADKLLAYQTRLAEDDNQQLASEVALAIASKRLANNEQPVALSLPDIGPFTSRTQDLSHLLNRQRPSGHVAGSATWCTTTRLLPDTFGGVPTAPVETRAEPDDPSWAPVSYTLVVPNDGTLELSNWVAVTSPGPVESDGFGFRTTTAHLTSSHAVISPVVVDRTLRAIPRISGLAAFGGRGWDYAGFAVWLNLSVAVLSADSTDGTLVSSTVGIAGASGYASAIGARMTLDDRRIPIEVSLPSSPASTFISILLSLTGMTFAELGGSGYALIDLDGKTTPPGPSQYHAHGGAQIDELVIADPRCPIPIDRFTL